jgi:hypothetical protein
VKVIDTTAHVIYASEHKADGEEYQGMQHCRYEPRRANQNKKNWFTPHFVAMVVMV